MKPRARSQTPRLCAPSEPAAGRWLWWGRGPSRWFACGAGSAGARWRRASIRTRPPPRCARRARQTPAGARPCACVGRGGVPIARGPPSPPPHRPKACACAPRLSPRPLSANSSCAGPSCQGWTHPGVWLCRLSQRGGRGRRPQVFQQDLYGHLAAGCAGTHGGRGKRGGVVRCLPLTLPCAARPCQHRNDPVPGLTGPTRFFWPCRWSPLGPPSAWVCFPPQAHPTGTHPSPHGNSPLSPPRPRSQRRLQYAQQYGQALGARPWSKYTPGSSAHQAAQRSQERQPVTLKAREAKKLAKAKQAPVTDAAGGQGRWACVRAWPGLLGFAL